MLPHNSSENMWVAPPSSGSPIVSTVFLSVLSTRKKNANCEAKKAFGLAAKEIPILFHVADCDNKTRSIQRELELRNKYSSTCNLLFSPRRFAVFFFAVSKLSGITRISGNKNVF